MKGLVITGIVGIVFFGGAYAYSTMQLAQQIAEQEKEDEAKEGSEGLEDPQKPTDQDKTDFNNQPKDGVPQVPFSPQSLTEAAVLDLVESVKAKEILIKKREEELSRREQRMRYILDDIKLEKREFEAVVHRAQAKVIESQKILQLIETKKQQIDEDVKKIEQMQKVDASLNSSSQDAANQELAKLFESIQPEDFAATLTEYVNNGEIDKAGDYLSYIEKGKASKAINAIADPALRRQVLEALKLAYLRKQESQLSRTKKR